MSRTKPEQALDFARELAGPAPHWTVLHNALFGIGGKLIELFPSEADRAAFAKTEEFKAIHAMVDQLRGQAADEPAAFAELVGKANGAISVRLPKSVHAALLLEAEAEGVSLNQLCLAKLCVQLRSLRGPASE